jgi:hypothetical protein
MFDVRSIRTNQPDTGKRLNMRASRDFGCISATQYTAITGL